MKPTKSKENQACQHWVSVEIEDWAEAWVEGVDWWLGLMTLRPAEVWVGDVETER